MILAKTRDRRTWMHLTLGGGTVIFLGWTLRGIPLSQIWTLLTHIHPGAFALLIALNLLILWFFGGRGWVILRALGHRIPYRNQVTYRLAAFSVNYFTPGPQFGGEPLHIYLLTRRQGIPWEDALTAVAVDRLLEWTVNITFLFMGLSILLSQDIIPVTTRLPLIGGIGFLVVLPLAYLMSLRQGIRPFTALLKNARSHHGHLPRKLDSLASSENRAVRLLREHPQAMLVALSISLVTWGLLIGEYALMLWTLGVHLNPRQLIAVMTAARIAFLFPTPGGLGALEAGQVLALTALGYNPAVGISLSLLIRSRDIIVGLLGVIWGLLYGKHATEG